MRLSLLELIAHVGQENIRVQPLNSCITNATSMKKRGVCRVTFETKEMTPGDLLGVGTAHIGLILWIERSRLP